MTKTAAQVLGLFLCGTALLNAQSLLTSEEAVRIALQKNFSISLSRDQTAEATINRQSGVGPFLPGVSASATTAGRLTDSITHTTTVGVSANWQIFDGFRSVNAYQRLKSVEKAAQLQERLAVESTVETVLNAYYGVVLQKQLMTTIKELLGVAQDQATLARAKTEIGAGSKLDELTALATLNEDSSSLLAEEIALRQARIQLNLLLSRDPSTPFEVVDSIPLERDLNLENLNARLKENNATILQAKAQQSAAASGLSEARGSWWPSLNANVGYSAEPSALNSGGGNKLNGNGTYGVSLTVPIFDQLQTHQAVSIARLQLRSGDTQVRQAEISIQGEFEQDRVKYLSGLQQVSLEERNLEVAKQQDDAAHEQYKVGKITALDLRAADQLLLNARNRLVTGYQNTKLAELALKRLSGFLVAELPSDAQDH